MTVINAELKIRIDTLQLVNYGYKKIAKTLNLNRNTVKGHIRKKKELALLPPPIKQSKHKIKGRDRLRIKKYLDDYPTATLEQLRSALNFKPHI